MKTPLNSFKIILVIWLNEETKQYYVKFIKIYVDAFSSNFHEVEIASVFGNVGERKKNVCQPKRSNFKGLQLTQFLPDFGKILDS